METLPNLEESLPKMEGMMRLRGLSYERGPSGVDDIDGQPN